MSKHILYPYATAGRHSNELKESQLMTDEGGY